MANGDNTQLRAQVTASLEKLAGLNAPAALDTAKPLVETLRNSRDYEAMARLAEAISRVDPKDAKNRRLYGQALIETGKATVAIDLLQSLIRRIGKGDPEVLEATGLLGRANKQIFFDAGDKSAPVARDALKQAIAAYRKVFEEKASTWHGVNLLALVANGRRLGVSIPAVLKPADIAAKVMQSLAAVPTEKRDEWYLSTVAEANLALENWQAVEDNLRAYVAQPNASAFPLASTLRQFTEIWNLESTERGKGLVGILRAALMKLPGGTLEVDPGELQRLRQEQPSAVQLEAVLGEHGAQTYQWWKTGMTRALSVASIRQRLGSRIGTGFLVRAGDIGIAPADELVVLTNFHVVNEQGASPGIRPDQAEVVFEAVDAATAYTIDKILWSSPPEQCDASVLRVTKPIVGITPLPIARALPALGESAQVYVVGYPGGRDLAFSFQDNELLDHEGPPAGHPQIPGVCRVHYRAPTEGGSSGSPVFNSALWEVIGLHHKGGRMGMPHLNGVAGTYAANEGIAIQSIATFPKS
jgi:hypothetical protein